MRYYEDTNYYYFSTEPSTDELERAIVIENSKEYFKQMMSEGLRPEKSAYMNIVKYSVLAVFLGAVALMIFFSSTKNVAGVLYTFAGLFIAFGIFALFPSKKPVQDLPGRAKLPRVLGGAIPMLIGLAVLIPAVMARVWGFSKAMVAGGASWFVIAALFFIFYTVSQIVRQNKTSGHTVTGKCIGYVKMLDSDSNNSSVRTVIGAPVFKYSYSGETYKAFQDDNMRTGVLKPAVGESIELNIDTSDPYNICYRKNTGARVFAFVMSFIALAVGIGLFCYLPNVNDDQGVSVGTMGGQVRLAKAKFDDDLIESYAKTSDFTIGYYTVVSTSEQGDSVIVELSNGKKRTIPASDKDKYYDGAGVYIVKPADGSGGFSFMADEWEYTGSHEVQYG